MLLKQTCIFGHCNIDIFLTNISFMFNQWCSEHGYLLIQLDSIKDVLQLSRFCAHDGSGQNFYGS